MKTDFIEAGLVQVITQSVDEMTELILYRHSFGIIDRQDKADGWERIVTGVVADPETVDSYGNIIDAETIRRAALEFMEYFQNMGVNHEKGSDGTPVVLNDQIRILESWVTRGEETINGRRVPAGAWVLTVRILDDEIWEGVLNGEFVGFSLEAICQRVPLTIAA